MGAAVWEEVDSPEHAMGFYEGQSTLKISELGSWQNSSLTASPGRELTTVGALPTKPMGQTDLTWVAPGNTFQEPSAALIDCRQSEEVCAFSR